MGELGSGEAVLNLGLCHSDFFGEEERGVQGNRSDPGQSQIDFRDVWVGFSVTDLIRGARHMR